MKTYIERNKDKLKDIFKNVYFITGTATGGKTTISKEIAKKYGFIRYDVDEEFDKHQKLSNASDQPAMNKEFQNADEFFLRDKYEYVNWLLKNRKEQLDFVLEDIANLSRDNVVVCDIHLDVEEARLITDTSHIVFLIKEDNKHIIEDYINRKSHEGFKKYIYSSSNPILAKENCNEVLRIINEEKCNRIKNSEFKYIERNENSTVENTLNEVEKIFKLKR